jgi:mannose-1-phosphate guanylyltransferase
VINQISHVLKALLLIGGQATRLRPLSLNRPKCLFPLNNKPIIDYLLENLSNAGCKDAILAVNYLADKIENYLGTEKYGVKLHYSLEETPLGTGGPVKLAQEYLCDEDFLVLNGDILSFINYRELMNTHISNEATATLALKQVEDPSRFGVVRFSKGDTINEFVEKPTRENTPSNWINAGCYALSPEILQYIPGDRKVSIEREVFPKLTFDKKLAGYRYYGEWIDIGVPDDYLQANRILQSRHDRASSMNPNIKIGKGSRILDSIVWENTWIGSTNEITGTIIGANCIIGDRVKITGSVIADNVTINDDVLISKGARVWPMKTIENSIIEENQEIK